MVTIHKACTAPRLLPMLCNQTEVLTENIIAKIANQLLDIVGYLQDRDLIHGSLDIDCIQVTKFDISSNTIEIKVDGCEQRFLQNSK